MADPHGVVAPPKSGIPGLYATGKAPKLATQSKAKKALRFEDSQDNPTPLMPTAPPASAIEDKEEEITEHDTATQTTNEEETEPLAIANDPSVQTSTTETTDHSESQEEEKPKKTGTLIGHGRPPKRTKKFHHIYLTRSTKGKQFRPCSPISNQAAYPIVRYQHAGQFKTAASELNTHV